MGVADEAAARMAYWCATDEAGGVGYDQGTREEIRDLSYVSTPHLTGAVDSDCSAMVAAACNLGLRAAGVVPADAGDGDPRLLPASTWTGSMRAELEARGWREVHWDDSAMTPDGGFRKGDVVLSSKAEGGVGHVAMVVDDNPSDPVLAEAWIDERGEITGGAVGDQTGSETRLTPYTSHIYTQRGAWTSCHRYAASSSAPAPSAPPAPAAPNPAPSSGKPGPLLGVDISNYQAGMSTAAVDPDFVIVMVTQDTGRFAFTNQYHQAQLDEAVSQGRPVGVYHYVGGGDSATASDAEAEADRFLDAVRATGHFNRVMWCIDWEADDNIAWGNLAYLGIIIDRVQRATGKPVMLYASSGSYPWDLAVQYGCGTWAAQYADDEPTGWDRNPWSDGTWSAQMHQYTGHGRVPGYDDDLDLDVFYGSEDDFRAYAIDSSSAPSAPRRAPAPSARPRPTAPDGQDLLDVDGQWGPRTVARFQQVMGTPIDGVLDDDGSTCVEAFQRFLNTVVSTGDQDNLNGSSPLVVDGVDGENTWRVFQYLVWCWHPEYVPDGWDWGDWIDGVDGPATVMALQRALNVSTAGSGRLW
jgi:GH25 family lysozyme M1 (1,4-beta-N-acetylmuramidase)